MNTRLTTLTAALLLASGAAHADFVIIDDLIVDGSSCIGFDCVNGESFGFDTIRLKENNLRIKFDDTSVAASFPRNDWQLTANDSANGGASKFSIDDISGSRTPFTVEANARSHALYVDDGGRIGSRTSTPSVEIHTIDGDTPTLRLQQDGSSGFAPQTWDVAGNETNFFIRDVTNGSSLPLRIRPGAPTSSIFIDTTGYVGLGDTSPDSPLTITRSDGNAKFLVEETNTTVQARTMMTLKNNGGARIVFNNTDTGTSWKLNTNSADRMVLSQNGAAAEAQLVLEEDSSSGTMYIGIGDTNPAHPIEHVSGAHLTDGGVWTDASSRAMKKDIRKLGSDEANATLAALQPVSYEYIKEAGERYNGFIAEDVPEAVAHNNRASLSAMDFVAVLTKVVQDQKQEISMLKERLNKLENAD